MKTAQNEINILALVPHRDARKLLRDWSASLFTAGVHGAWSFPWVAPLKLLDNPLSGNEFKELTRNIRQNNEIFTTGEAVSIPFPMDFSDNDKIFLYGVKLEESITPSHSSTKEGVIIIGAALHYGTLPENLPAPPKISFRAAALANMSFGTLACGSEQGGFSFEWNIGELKWLPKMGN